MRLIILSILIASLTSCSVSPQPIIFGKDACVYCKMNIVDQQHAAEVVSKKGKVFKYDAIECLLKDSKNNNTAKTSMYLVVNYLKPNDGFIDATKSTYLISESIPSPMGAYLSAFSEKRFAMEQIKSEKDRIYSWSEIQNIIY